MNGYEKVKLKKKAAIKDAASRLFMENGLRDVKIEDIAQVANVSQVTIYNHFGSKEALVRIIGMEMLERQFQEIEKLVLGDLPIQDKLQYLITQIMASVEFLPRREFLDSIQQDEVLKNEMRVFHEDKIMPLFIKMMKDAEAKGEICDHLSEDSIRFCFVLFQSNSDKFRTFLTGEDAQQRMQEIMHLFFYGIIKRD